MYRHFGPFILTFCQFPRKSNCMVLQKKNSSPQNEIGVILSDRNSSLITPQDQSKETRIFTFL